MALTLTPDERTELERRMRSRTIRSEAARRARVILMLADGASYPRSRGVALLPRLHQSLASAVPRQAAGRPAVAAPFQPPSVLTADDGSADSGENAATPPDGSTHWSTRKLGRLLQINHNHVANAWRRAGLQPHRFERYMQSDDPDFEQKAADVIGLYLNPPQHAAVFAVDEKTAIQALDRLDPVLPLSPGRAERHGFEYYRHGTLSLFAALNTRTGEVVGQTVPRHTSAAFVEFLAEVVAGAATGEQIHVISRQSVDPQNPSRADFLIDHPKVRLHFTPTYSSWLNQVELWFSKIERDLLARGIFTSVPDLARRIRTYIRHYNKAPKPIRWSYSNPAHRISSTSAYTGH